MWKKIAIIGICIISIVLIFYYQKQLLLSVPSQEQFNKTFGNLPSFTASDFEDAGMSNPDIQIPLAIAFKVTNSQTPQPDQVTMTSSPGNIVIIILEQTYKASDQANVEAQQIRIDLEKTNDTTWKMIFFGTRVRCPHQNNWEKLCEATK